MTERAPEPANDPVGAIVVGAGSGLRLGGVEKAFVRLCGHPLLFYSVQAFERAADVHSICLVLSAASLERGAALAREYGWRKVQAIVAGGRERQDSVSAGLRALADCEWVLVHDAARPLLTPDIITRGLAAARDTGAAVAATPVRDTLKRVNGGDAARRVVHTIDRSELWAAQTPQVFRAALLRRAFADAGERASTFTDDASLVEAMGHPVAVFDGGSHNVKLTFPEDVALVEALLRASGGASS